ncbi:MAG: glycosyltransferase family 2 protein [Synechococcaceae cyanobacterium]|nr:glycosyltransferase family 2 protein [Synechococcaceae cyanobacterium]
MDAGGSSTDRHGEPGSADRRRLKAALFLLLCGAAGIAPHTLPPGLRLLPAALLAVLLGGHGLVTVLRGQRATAPPPSAAAQSTSTAGPSPVVEVVVAARDEQAVIARLVERVTALRWPAGQLRLWVIDDGSEDRTPEVLADLQTRVPQLRVLRRPRDAGGGKSGALNLVLRELSGRWLLVLDADADLQPDTLERLIPFAEAGGWAAVQLRKAVVNAPVNLLTGAQAMEMAFDALIQAGRQARGGVGELRGNGQLLRREAVVASGGFNESTITDDLDLSLRLVLVGHPVGVLWDPPVGEEAVLSLRALWRQRQRWAEGGLQRFLDHGFGFGSGRLNRFQTLDLFAFFLLQYAMPVLAAADLAGVLLTGTAPLMWPFSLVAMVSSALGLVAGCRRVQEGPPLPALNPFHTTVAILYLTHWFVVIPWVSLRMALLPKRLVWAKTLHLGDEEGPLAGEAEAELAAGGGQA